GPGAAPRTHRGAVADNRATTGARRDAARRANAQRGRRRQVTFPGVIDIHWSVMAPAITLLDTTAVTLFFALSARDSRGAAAVAIIGFVTASVFTVAQLLAGEPTASSFGLRYLGDVPALALTIVILLGTAIAVLVSWDQLGRGAMEHPEYYP